VRDETLELETHRNTSRIYTFEERTEHSGLKGMLVTFDHLAVRRAALNPDQ